MRYALDGRRRSRAYLTRYGSKRIARVALIGTTLPFLMKTADNPEGIDPTVFESGRRTSLLRDFPGTLQDKLPPFALPETSTAMLEWVRNLMLQTSMKALVECNRALTSTDFCAELAEVDLPVLLIHGDKDVSSPIAMTARKAEALLRKAALRVKIYEGAPHGLILTHADRLNDDLLAFVSG